MRREEDTINEKRIRVEEKQIRKVEQKNRRQRNVDEDIDKPVKRIEVEDSKQEETSNSYL